MTDLRTYADFDLLIEGLGNDGYRARVLESPAGSATASFALPFTDLELEVFLLKVGRPRRGTRRLESPEMGAAREFGKKLYEAVFHDDLKLSLQRSLDEAERRDEGLRIRLRFTDAPELASLPWEFLYDESDDQFLVLSTWTPISRYLDLSQRIDPLIVNGPLRILAMISSPHDYPELDVDEEWRRIESALKDLVELGAVIIERTEDATLLDLQRRLRKSDYHVFHFVGHGGFDQNADDGVLVMEDGNNRSRLVAGRDIATILNDQRDLRLVVLNACEGARSSTKDPFSGVAQSMVRKGIPAVVAMQFEITDGAAIAFSQEFYGAVADSYSLDAAIGEARRAIFGLGNDIEWGTPVVYMRGDGRLFDVQRTSQQIRTGSANDTANGPPTEATAEKDSLEVAVGSSPDDSDAQSDMAPTSESDRTLDTDTNTSDLSASSHDAVDIEEKLLDEGGPASIALTPDSEQLEGPSSESSPGTANGVQPRGATEILDIDQPQADKRTDKGRRSGLIVSSAVVGLALALILAVWILPEDDNGTTSPQGTTPETIIAESGQAVAQRSSGPKVIDALATDWPNAFFHETDHLIYHWAEIREDPSARLGEQNTALIQLAWDDTYLYLFADVNDDIIALPESGDQIWQNDAVSLNLSVIGPDGVISETADEDDHQLTLDANGASAHYVIGGDALSLGFADSITEHTTSGYTLEARLPWEEIGVRSPQSGDSLGLLLTVFDNDNDFPQADIVANTAPAGEELDNRWFRGPRTWGGLTLDD